MGSRRAFIIHNRWVKIMCATGPPSALICPAAATQCVACSSPDEKASALRTTQSSLSLAAAPAAGAKRPPRRPLQIDPQIDPEQIVTLSATARSGARQPPSFFCSTRSSSWSSAKSEFLDGLPDKISRNVQNAETSKRLHY